MTGFHQQLFLAVENVCSWLPLPSNGLFVFLWLSRIHPHSLLIKTITQGWDERVSQTDVICNFQTYLWTFISPDGESFASPHCLSQCPHHKMTMNVLNCSSTSLQISWDQEQYSRYLKAPISNPSQPHPVSSLTRAAMQPPGQRRVAIHTGAHQNNLFFLTKPQWCVGRARYFPSTEGSLPWKVVGLDLFVQGSQKYLERIPRGDAKPPVIWSGVQHGLLLKFVLFCSWAACAASLMAALLCAPCLGLSPRFRVLRLNSATW